MIVFRLLQEQAKQDELLKSVTAARAGGVRDTFLANPEDFASVPGTPFCYWASDRVWKMFSDLTQFEEDERMIRVGLQSGDDFRFLRLRWEVPAENLLDAEHGPCPHENALEFQEWCRERSAIKRWVLFAKGGEYKPILDDPHLVVDWKNDGQVLKQWKLHDLGQGNITANNSKCWNEGHYFRCGLTWPRRTNSNFGIRILPPGCIFADKGPAAFVPPGQELCILGILFSLPFQYLIELRLAAGEETTSGSPSRSYEVGIIRKLPWPEIASKSFQEISAAVEVLLDGLLSLEEQNELSSRFVAPALGMNQGSVRDAALLCHKSRNKATCQELVAAAKVDRIVANALGVATEKRESVFGPDAGSLCDYPDCQDAAEMEELYTSDLQEVIQNHLREHGGDRRVAVKSFYVSRHIEVLARVTKVNPRSICELADSKCLMPKGYESEFGRDILSYVAGVAFGRWDVEFATGKKTPLTRLGGLSPLPVRPPSAQSNLADNAHTSRQKLPTAFVDDIGHKDDLLARCDSVLASVWPTRFEEIRSELEDLMGVAGGLRAWFTKSFFDFHTTKYSASRRKAPIYWQFATHSGSYSVWLYYHRFTKDTFFQVLNEYVKPKLNHERQKLERVRSEGGPEPTRSQRKEIEDQEKFVAELASMVEEVERIAPLWNPNLNDGVIINFAPLWRLVPQNKSWQKECKSCWDKLVKGEYDWAHLAIHLWPERVVPKCRDDCSLAIAHNLQDLLWVEDGGRWRKLLNPEEEIAEQKQRRYYELRERLRDSLSQLALERGGKLTAHEAFEKLSSGDWDDSVASLLLWPDRVIRKCSEDPSLADRHGIKFPKNLTKDRLKRVIKSNSHKECLSLVLEIEEALSETEELFVEAWNALSDGRRDEMPLALSLWPDRVIDGCVANLELAKRHNLERFFWLTDRDNSWRRRMQPEDEISWEVEYRSSPSVKSALKSLLEAPTPANSARRTKRRRATTS